MPKKILYVEDDPDIRELYSLKFESEFGFAVIEASSAAIALEKLEEESVDLVVSDFNMPDGNGDIVYRRVREKSKSLPFVFLTTENITTRRELEGFLTNEKNAHLIKPLNNELFRKTCDELLSGIRPTNEEAEELKYISLRIERLYSYNEISADLFVKLSDQKFVKILSKNDMFDHNFLSKYKDRGVAFVYVRREEYTDFTRRHTNALSSRLKDESITDNIRIHAQVEIYQQIKDSLEHVGLNHHTIEMAQAAFESSLEVFGKSKDLFTLLDKMMKRKDYIIEHSVMASYFCYIIAKQMDWNNAKTLAKLNFAAIFHDSDLVDEKIARVDSIHSDEFNRLNPVEQKIFKEHPVRAASVVRSLPDAPENIDMVIMQHHEVPDGSGFPRGLVATTIAPMACVFILAHQMAHYFYSNGFSEVSKEKCLDILQINFNKGNFKKPLAGLLRHFKKT